MKLGLTYQAEKTATAAAVFLSTPKLTNWLEALSRWEIALQDMECYPVPSGITDPTVVGLFVIFKKGEIPAFSSLASTYQCIAKQFYIPTEATFSPQVLPHEWEDLLIHDRNLYHPRIGLVGFSTQDQLDFKKYLITPDLVSNQWKHAQKGSTPHLPLTSIKLNTPPVSDLLSKLKSEMSTRPLDEIPGGDKEQDQSSRKDINALQRFLLKKLSDATKGGKKQDRDQSSQRPHQSRSPFDGPGWEGFNPFANLFGKANAWLNQKLEYLEKRREHEIQRLLRMLDDDPDQALRYSIPLDGPYKNRGTAPPSSRLGQRNPDFNLGKIGGGGKADFWNLDKHYYSLREKYQKTAKKQLEKGDFRKAAYIYAHLLGDFHSAANALKQGKYYREAATLYKQHLNNTPLAATCLEEGGLILEAIDLYKELAKHEKVGDLYNLLDQTHQAQPHYEKAMVERLKADNYLEACRICEDKLGELERTQKLLLEGWKTSKQSEECLLRYFEHKNKHEGVEVLEEQIKWVYQQHVPTHKKRDFIPILISLKQKHKQLKASGQEIAYEIISENAVNGQPDLLPKLRHFVDQDPLLHEDTSRFLYQNKGSTPPFTPKAKAIQLDPTVKWKAAVAYNRSLIIMGLKSGKLHIARANWKGKVLYAATTHQVQESIQFRFLEANGPSAELIVLSSQVLNIDPINLPVDYHFQNEIRLEFPQWIPQKAVRICRGRGHRPSVLVINHNTQVQCLHYDIEGNIAATYDCKVQEQPLFWEGEEEFMPMYFRDNHFYTFMGGKVLRIAMKGDTEVLSGSGIIKALHMSPAGTAKRLVFQKDTYLTYLQPTVKELNAGRKMLRNKLKNPEHFAFLTSRNLLIAGENSGEVYDLKYHRIIWRFPSKASLIAITPAAGRREFALIHANGLITIREVPAV